MMGSQRVASTGKNIPLAKAGRHDRPAPQRRTTSPLRGAKVRAVYRWDGAVPLATASLVFARRLDQPCYRDGPYRAGQIGGPVGRSSSGHGIVSGLG